MINNWEKLIHMKNYRVFQKVMKNSPMMDDPESRSLIGALCVLESIGTTGLRERIKLLKQHKIIFSRADLLFTMPLILYDIITKLAMRNIVPAMMKSRDIHEFYDNLNPLGRMLVYAHVKSLMSFYLLSIEMQKRGDLPDVGQDFINGFQRLHDLRVEIEKRFRPGHEYWSSLRTYVADSHCRYQGKNKMMFYMAVTDTMWTMNFISNIMRFNLPVLRNIVGYVEKSFIQKFFNRYYGAIDYINKKDYPDRYAYYTLHDLIEDDLRDDISSLDNDAFALLRMIYEIDMATYSELIFYYSNCNILPDAFFEDFNKFFNNVLLVRDKVH